LDTKITLQQLFDIYDQAFNAPVPLKSQVSMDIGVTRFAAILLITHRLGFTHQDPALADDVYTDLDQIAENNRRYIPALAAATLHKLVVNYPEQSQLRPNAPITQAEFASLIYQGLVATGKTNPIESDYIVQVNPLPNKNA
ncbi:MAG: hypothetical protein F6K11_29575, partial [Leptolyngbya sp. SIO3F4]|nr:hypothetical protein [Leptolyngbya sp. SIO3F4]